MCRLQCEGCLDLQVLCIFRLSSYRMSGPCHSLYGEAVLLALHSLPHSVVVARLDHLGYQLQEGVMEGVRSEVVGMAIPVLLGVMVVGSLRDLLRK